jgi:NAD-dependent dihydropyrimidine dehydrogenase PreA subunit
VNIIIYYFSGTGNTWWASLKLKEELEKHENTVEMYSLENNLLKEKDFTRQKIENIDHIIIGFPIYGSDLPENMEKFIYDLPNVSDKKKITTFCTQSRFSGNGNIFFKKNIENKGYTLLQSFQLNLTTNFHVAMFPFSLFKPAKNYKLERKKNNVDKKIKKIVHYIQENKKYIEGKKIYQVLLGNLQRCIFKRNKKKLSKKFIFSHDRCIKCKLCVQNCPTKNLILKETAKLILKRKKTCLLCFRCYNFCPTRAINFGKENKNPYKYKRYTGPIENLDICSIKK